MLRRDVRATRPQARNFPRNSGWRSGARRHGTATDEAGYSLAMMCETTGINLRVGGQSHQAFAGIPPCPSSPPIFLPLPSLVPPPSPPQPPPLPSPTPRRFHLSAKATTTTSAMTHVATPAPSSRAAPCLSRHHRPRRFSPRPRPPPSQSLSHNGTMMPRGSHRPPHVRWEPGGGFVAFPGTSQLKPRRAATSPSALHL